MKGWVFAITALVLVLLNSSSIVYAQNWWDADWAFRKQITITNNHLTKVAEQEYTVFLTFDMTDLVSQGKMLPNGDDARIVWYNTSNGDNVELDRINTTDFGLTDTTLAFALQEDTPSGISDGNYYMYYGNMGTGNPPIDASIIYLFAWDKIDLSQFSIVGLAPSVIDNKIVFTGFSCCTFERIQTIETFSRPLRMEMTWETSEGRYGAKSGNSYTFVMGFNTGSGGSGYNFYTNEGYGWSINVLGSPPFTYQNGPTVPSHTTIRTTATLNETDVMMDVFNDENESLLVSLGGPTTVIDNKPIRLEHFDNLPGVQEVNITDFMARKFITPEPSTMLGDEESNDPQIMIKSPENTTYTTNNISLNVFAKYISTSDIDTWWYVLNQDLPVVFQPNTTFISPIGFNNLSVFFNDTNGTVYSSSVGFSVNSNPPNISGLPDINTVEDIGFLNDLIYLPDFAYDQETSSELLDYYIIQQSDPSIINCVIDSGLNIDCTTQLNMFGYSIVEVGVSDGQYNDSDNFSIYVAPLNDPPVLGPIGNKAVNENSILTIQLNATDPELDVLTFGTDAAITLPSAFSFDPGNGIFVWTPTFDDEGQYNVTFNVTDGEFTDQETITIIVSNTNRPPVISNLSDINLTEDQGFVDDLLHLPDYATDPDDDDIFFNMSQTNPSVVYCSIDLNNSLDCTTQPDAFGFSEITITVSDLDLDSSDTMIVNVIPVNDPPMLDPIGDRSVNENSTLFIQLGAFDIENDTLTFGTDAASTLPSDFSFNPVTGLFEWTPTFYDAGNYSVMFNVTDGELTDEETITIAVYPVNSPPTISGLPDLDLHIKSGLNSDLLYLPDFASDIETLPQDLVYTIINESTVSIVDCSITVNKYLECFVPSHIEGSSTVIIEVSDGELQDSDSMIVNVINTPPDVYLPDIDISEDSGLNDDIIYIPDYVDDNESDPTLMTYLLAKITSFGVADCWIDTNLYLDCTTLVQNGNGYEQFVLTVLDYNVFTNDTFILTVTPVNDPPSINNLPDQTIYENSGLNNDLIDLDQYSFDVDGDNLTYSVTFESNPEIVDCFVDGNGFLDCQTQQDKSGFSIVVVQVSDGDLIDDDVLIVVVLPVNDPPTITSTPVTEVFINKPYSYDVEAQDPDNDSLLFNLTQFPSGMQIDPVTGLITWIPHQPGEFPVTVSVTDSLGGWDFQTYNITVNTPGLARNYIVDKKCELIRYDTFNTPPLNTNKWSETTTTSFPTEHLVNPIEKAFHIAQLSASVRDHHLTMTYDTYDEIIEYDVDYVSGSGDQHMHNFHFAPYGYPWYSGNWYIGYSGGTPGEWGTQTGKYHIKLDFNSTAQRVDIVIKRPDGSEWTGFGDLSFTSPPYHLLLQASTTGTMHFDYDNVVIKKC